MPAVLITEGRVYKEYSKFEENMLDFPVFHNEVQTSGLKVYFLNADLLIVNRKVVKPHYFKDNPSHTHPSGLPALLLNHDSTGLSSFTFQISQMASEVKLR